MLSICRVRSLTVVVAAMTGTKLGVHSSIGLAGSSLDVSELAANSAVVTSVPTVSKAVV